MTCDKVRDLLPALSLDALDGGACARLATHLARCVCCESERRAYQAVVAHLALALPQCEPPAELKQRVLTAAARSRRTPVRRRPFWSGRVTTVVNIALSLGLGMAFVVAKLPVSVSEWWLLAANLWG